MGEFAFSEGDDTSEAKNPLAVNGDGYSSTERTALVHIRGEDRELGQIGIFDSIFHTDGIGLNLMADY